MLTITSSSCKQFFSLTKKSLIDTLRHPPNSTIQPATEKQQWTLSHRLLDSLDWTMQQDMDGDGY